MAYLASDDPEAIKELREGLASDNIEVVQQAMDRDFMARNTEQCAILANMGVRTLNAVILATIQSIQFFNQSVIRV